MIRPETGNLRAVSGSVSIRRQTLVAAALLVSAALVVLLVQQLAIEPAGAANTKIVSNSSTLTGANDTPRKTVLCPQKGKKQRRKFGFPYGGGMFSTTPGDPDGGGVYPHSYERLGVQHGYHVTPVNYDPSLDTPVARNVTLQVVCGPEPGKLTPPHKTTQVNPGQVATHVLTCPGRRKLIGGGFQRTTFVGPIRGAPPSGVFPTESQAINPKTWQVSGEAFGKFGGELTGIAYCRRSGKPIIKEVSASTTVLPGQFGSVTSPTCPGKRKLVYSGFTTLPLGSIFYAGGPINKNQSVVATGYNRSLAPAILTSEGYCMKVKAK
jgi:hypothetical protein